MQFSPFFYLLLITSLPAINAAPPVIPAEQHWRNSLRSDEDIALFLHSPLNMARETLSVHQQEVFMGSDHNGNLTLEAALKTIAKMRGKHNGILLSIPSTFVFYRALPTLFQYNGSSWISLAFELVKGPNGGQPSFDGDALNKMVEGDAWPRKVRMVLETTGTLKGAEKAYNEEVMINMASEFVKMINVQKQVEDDKLAVDLGLDLYLASHTRGLHTLPVLSRFSMVHFSCMDSMTNKVNVPNFHLVFERLTPYRVYLNVPPGLQRMILNYRPPDDSGADGERGRNSWKILIFAFVLWNFVFCQSRGFGAE